MIKKNWKMLALLALCLGVLVGYRVLDGLRRDNVAPKIKISDASPAEMSVYAPEALLEGVTATDDRDGDLTDKIRIERVSRFGDQNQVDVSFVVFDSAGNMSRHYRTVYYDDYTPPRFALTEPLVYNEGAAVGVMDRLKLYDVLEGDISYKVKLEDANVNDSQSGMYEVTLRAVTDHGVDVCVRVPLNVLKYNSLAPKIILSEYLVYVKKGEALDPVQYISDVRDCNGFPIDFKLVFVYPQVDTTRYGVRITCVTDWPPEGDHAKIEFSMDKVD